MKKLLTVAVTVPMLLIAHPVRASDDTTTTTQPSSVTSGVTVIHGVTLTDGDPATEEYRWQVAHGAPNIRYWQLMAQCETRQDWKDHGRWSGGLGIFNQGRFPKNNMGTWERWGGEQFGPTPQSATPIEQVVVANRIGFFGYEGTYRYWDGRIEKVRLKHYKKPPAGFRGWGCWDYSSKLRRRTINAEKRRRAMRPLPVYKVHEIHTPDLGVPAWAWDKIPHKYLK